MSNATGTRSGQDKVRAWCHDVIDKVADLSENQLRAAESALDKASSDSVRQKLVELSVSESDDITAVFVRAAIRQGSTQVARAAADLLMDIKSADSALSVIQECLNADDLSVKCRAVEAIETLEDPSALDLLTSSLDSEEDGVRRAATNSFGLVIGSKYHELAHHILEAIEKPDSRMFKVISQSPDVNLRREVAQSLGFARTERVLPLLKKMAHDPDRQTRRESVLALAAITTDRSTEILRDLLDDPDGLVVASVLDALAARYGRDSTRMLGALQKAIEHPDSNVRKHAVLMLNQFPPQEVRDLLKKAAHDDAFEVQMSANSLLRTMHTGTGLAGLGDDRKTQTDTERTLSIWEAGNIGLECDAAQQHSMIESRSQATTDDVVPILEKAASGNFSSIRQHALTELIDLCDIADSPALQKGMFDDDESIRSRVAPALESTRDAGLLIRLLENHSDPTIRRRAVEALMDNPSGYTQGGEARKKLTFSAERSEGMIFFSYFLKALKDEDEGVRQLACRAIEEFVEFDCPLPVAETKRHLEELNEDESLSSLTHEVVQDLLDELDDTSLAKPVINAMDGIVEWIRTLITHREALKQSDDGDFILDPGCAIEEDNLREMWEESFHIAPDVVDEAIEAFQNEKPLPEGAGGKMDRGIRRAMKTCLNSVYHASGALAGIGEKRWADHPAEWAQSLDTNLNQRLLPEFNSDSESRPSAQHLQRLNVFAQLAARIASQKLNDKPDYADVHTCIEETDDDWIRLACMVLLAEETGEECNLERITALLETHADDPAFAEPVGRGAILALRDENDNALHPLYCALRNADVDLRCELTQRLMTTVQSPDAGNLLNAHLASHSIDDVARACMALALRGGTGETVDVNDELAENADGDTELICAVRALGAMDNREHDAEWLKEHLRNGEEEVRYMATSYLGLARVHSALPVWASVSDQVEAPWELRTLNAAMLVRNGHRLGIRWFAKNAEQRPAHQKPAMATHLSRVIEEIIPLMHHCRNINLGRFV